MLPPLINAAIDIIWISGTASQQDLILGQLSLKSVLSYLVSLKIPSPISKLDLSSQFHISHLIGWESY